MHSTTFGCFTRYIRPDTAKIIKATTGVVKNSLMLLSENRRENQVQLSSFILHQLQQQKNFLSWKSTSQPGGQTLRFGTCSKEQLQLDRHIQRSPVYYYNSLSNNFLEVKLSLHIFPGHFEKSTIEKDQEEAHSHGSM
uniref:Uncharacterized protein n=2 Tax=Micrurus lemniscatus lemniscatus TaxID=129467 RepID=A0A2D4IX30_MICLE